MFTLTSVPRPTGGYVTTYGEFSSVRDCTVAARAIQALDPGKERHFSARNTDESFFDSHKILLTPGEHTPDIEIVLSDGRIVWLGDVDEVLRRHLDELGVPIPKVLDTHYEPEYR